MAAKLRELSPTSDPATRTYPARFTLLDRPPSVRLGMSVTVSLQADAAKVARMPISAVFDQGQGPSVWVVDPVTATLSAARVALAGYDADWAFIGAGVPEGAKVVALGVHKLDAGEKVHVVDTQELAAIASTELILPTAAPPGRELRLRCVVRPDRAQAVLLERLGLRLPEQLRMPRAARTT